jgi:hypothetical protein
MLSNIYAIPYIADIIMPKNISHGITYHETSLDESVLINSMVIPFWDGEFIENLNNFSIKNVDLFPTTFWQTCLMNVDTIDEEEWKILIQSKDGYMIAIDHCCILNDLFILDELLESDFCNMDIISKIKNALFPYDNEGSQSKYIYETYKNYIHTKYGKPNAIYELVDKNITGTKIDIRQAPWMHELMEVVHHPDRMIRQANNHNISFYEYLQSM